MANVYDVANFFIDACNNSTDDQMTNLKLNKLIYYAQGCHLARTGKPLFGDKIEAWTFGPVTPNVYQRYKVCGKGLIQNVDEDYNGCNFSSEEKDTLTDVMREFGKYTGSALVSMTHKAGTPWSKACVANEKEITQDSMKEFFEAHPVPRANKMFEQIPAVDKLPSDWYDPEEDAEWEAYQ